MVAMLTGTELLEGLRESLGDDVVVLEQGQVTRCPACGSTAWSCWAEIENEQRVEGVVVGCEIEAGLECRDCGVMWVEVQP